MEEEETRKRRRKGEEEEEKNTRQEEHVGVRSWLFFNSSLLDPRHPLFSKGIGEGQRGGTLDLLLQYDARNTNLDRAMVLIQSIQEVHADCFLLRFFIIQEIFTLTDAHYSQALGDHNGRSASWVERCGGVFCEAQGDDGGGGGLYDHDCAP
jgi:hypothetical protein